MSETADKPDWCPADLWLDTGMAFDQLYDAEPDLKGGCETSIRSMAARIALAERERCTSIARACAMDIVHNPHDLGPIDAGGIRSAEKIETAIRSPDTIGDRSKI